MDLAPKPLDSPARHWTDQLPAAARPYARLARLDRPAGWRLLALPCLMGLALARAGEGFAWGDLRLALLFVIGAVAMRGAGCVWNDILDRDIDAKVARTALRPIPSGQVSVKQALAFMAALLLAGLGVLLSLPPLAQRVALTSVPLVALYPLMKRITWWPQAWLGLVFSWGALGAGAAIDGAITTPIILLYLGCVAWVIAYDTIYARQDIEDDAIVGVKSTARLFGDAWLKWTRRFYGLAFVLWWLALTGIPFVSAVNLGLGAPILALCLVWMSFRLRRIDPADPASALAAFQANVWYGLAIVGAFAADSPWTSPRA